MLRITPVARTPGAEVLEVEGWLTGEATMVLAEAGGRVRQRGSRLVLELAGLRWIDDGGLALLETWAGPRLQLRHPSLLIAQVLTRRGLSFDESAGGTEPESGTA